MSADATSLANLHDVVAPPAMPWWPPAPAWYWVLGFLIVATFVGALRAFIHWQRNRYRREALAELERQVKLLRDPHLRASALARMAELLKRAAITAFGRDQVAALTGPVWFAFLDRSGGFNAGAAESLENGAYDSRCATSLGEANLRDIIESTRQWLKRHRKQPADLQGGVAQC